MTDITKYKDIVPQPLNDSKIEKLIAELCPEGIEYKELSEVSNIGTGSSNGNEATENGKYPLFVRSKFIKSIDTFEFDEEAIIIPGEGGIGEIFHYVNGKYALHQRAYRINIYSSKIITRFAYYYLFANFLPYILRKSVNATVKSIRKPMIERFLIPIPPLTIQQEIVKILDTFTTLEGELEAELKAELKARKKQYEYYRDELLTFGDDVEWKALREVGKWFGGGTPSKSNSEYWRDGVIPWLSPKDMRVPTIEATEDYITESAVANSATKMVPAGSVAIVVRSSILDRVLPVAFVPIPITLNQDMKAVVAHAEVLPKYISHIVRSHGQQVLRATKKTGGSVASIEVPKLMSYSIPIPPLTEQHRIVTILDKFDALVNDISVGLPAELNARRKQYEYYRNKLLTFKKFPSTGGAS